MVLSETASPAVVAVEVQPVQRLGQPGVERRRHGRSSGEIDCASVADGAWQRAQRIFEVGSSAGRRADRRCSGGCVNSPTSPAGDAADHAESSRLVATSSPVHHRSGRGGPARRAAGGLPAAGGDRADVRPGARGLRRRRLLAPRLALLTGGSLQQSVSGRCRVARSCSATSRSALAATPKPAYKTVQGPRADRRSAHGVDAGEAGHRPRHVHLG